MLIRKTREISDRPVRCAGLHRVQGHDVPKLVVRPLGSNDMDAVGVGDPPRCAVPRGFGASSIRVGHDADRQAEPAQKLGDPGL